MNRPQDEVFTRFFQSFDQLEALNDMVIDKFMESAQSAVIIDSWLVMLHDKRKKFAEVGDDFQVALSLFTTMGMLYGLKRNLEKHLQEDETDDR